MSRSLRTRMLVTFLALSVVPLLLVGVVLNALFVDAERQHAFAQQRLSAERAAEQITTYLESADAELRAIIQQPKFRTSSREQLQVMLAQSLFYTGTYDELTLLDPLGQEQVRISRLGMVAPAELRSRAEAPEFTRPMATNKSYYGPVYGARLNKEPLMILALPTLDARSGKPNGVLVGVVRLQQVWHRATNLQLAKTGTITIADAQGAILGHRDPGRLGQRINTSIDEEIVRDAAVGDVLRVVHPLRLGDQTLAIVADVPLPEALGNAARSTIISALAVLAMALIAALLAAVQVRQIARPIGTLAATAQAISSGDLSREVEVNRDDEIGALQRDFHQMGVALREQRAAIEERNRALEESFAAQRQLFQTVEELSTPLLPVWSGVVVLPVIGHVEERRGAQLMETLLNGVAQQRARVAILDITGVAAIDTYGAELIRRAVQAVELLGAEAMLAGISAAAAPRLIDAGLNLGTTAIYRDLQSAIAAALAREHAARAVGGAARPDGQVRRA